MTEMLELGSRQFPLRYTVNSVCCLEEKFGRGLHSVLHTDVACVRALVWCGLLDGDASLTLRQAGEYVEEYLKNGGALAQLAETCASALDNAGFFRVAKR